MMAKASTTVKLNTLKVCQKYLYQAPWYSQFGCWDLGAWKTDGWGWKASSKIRCDWLSWDPVFPLWHPGEMLPWSSLSSDYADFLHISVQQSQKSFLGQLGFLGYKQRKRFIDRIMLSSWIQRKSLTFQMMDPGASSNLHQQWLGNLSQECCS